MNTIEQILEQLRDTDEMAERYERLAAEAPDDDFFVINYEAIRKRRSDLTRRLNTELRVTQSDLVQYHVARTEIDRYPALAVAKAIAGFQELVTAVFDAIRTAPKQRYRPSADNVALSTLDFAMALPVGSVLVSMSVENERLIAVRSELDQTFERVFEILSTRDSEGLRAIAERVGIASISKAHDWAASTSQFGLNTKISVHKAVGAEPLEFEISNIEAQTLKEAIEEKSDRRSESETVVGELFGIDVDVDPAKSYFHIKTVDGRNLEGRLSDNFSKDQSWAVHVVYTAHLIKITTIRYATGEEKTDWLLAGLEDGSSISTQQ